MARSVCGFGRAVALEHASDWAGGCPPRRRHGLVQGAASASPHRPCRRQPLLRAGCCTRRSRGSLSQPKWRCAHLLQRGVGGGGVNHREAAQQAQLLAAVGKIPGHLGPRVGRNLRNLVAPVGERQRSRPHSLQLSRRRMATQHGGACMRRPRAPLRASAAHWLCRAASPLPHTWNPSQTSAARCHPGSRGRRRCGWRGAARRAAPWPAARSGCAGSRRWRPARGAAPPSRAPPRAQARPAWRAAAARRGRGRREGARRRRRRVGGKAAACECGSGAQLADYWHQCAPVGGRLQGWCAELG